MRPPAPVASTEAISFAAVPWPPPQRRPPLLLFPLGSRPQRHHPWPPTRQRPWRRLPLRMSPTAVPRPPRVSCAATSTGVTTAASVARGSSVVADRGRSRSPPAALSAIMLPTEDRGHVHRGDSSTVASGLARGDGLRSRFRSPPPPPGGLVHNDVPAVLPLMQPPPSMSRKASIIAANEYRSVAASDGRG